ncbi:30S ribosome-binding factor RbfA [Pararhodobacter zhoushanensis]|uniref:Ribosome-binding factor A n=1 Tax=Pararhodobacter zhoushanensis TaxID=2479545 RepID=A0ABT3GUY7_9RHOB|nr:30S ribosome-binding factor RbfA [Pararhodobacter zhoushanensis]MCW1931305.1 30S ribosome-binding factor RbfA [Pararhodobacter zhoushanensis]
MCAKRFSQGSGPSQRQLRVAEVIRHRLAEVFARGELHDPELSRVSITVTEVTITTDLRHAMVYVMPLGGEGAEEVLAGLKRHKAELRHLVAREMALKHAPELKFDLDGTFDRLEEARRLFDDPRVKADVAAPDEDDDA